MRLFYSHASPYSRKVRIVARERNLLGSLEEVAANPLGEAAELQSANPLGKIPALIVNEKFALYDSPVICEYLDTLGAAPQLVPVQGEARWLVLRAQALADGLLDSAVAIVYETRRPANEQSSTTMARWHGQIERALAAMAQQLPALPAVFNLGHIAFVSALGYLDLRHPAIDWRKAHPPLAAWFAALAQRPSVRDTLPQ
jgi:glutathione S-transferase